MAPCPAAEFPRLPASETAYRLARNQGRFLVQRQRLQRGKPFNVSSEHHIVHPRKGHAGGDAADARSSRQSAARMCSGASRRIVRVSDMSSKSSSHRHTRLQRDLSAAVPHMVCTIAAGSRPPVGAPSILMRKESAAFLVWNPPALASPVCDLPRPLANRCYCEAGECEVESAPTLPPFAIPRCSSLQIPKNAPCSLSRENPLQHLETITKFDRQRISSPCNF
jgi:hypothetical protein